MSIDIRCEKAILLFKLMSIVLDRKAKKELEELSKLSSTSKSELVRVAVEDLYLKETRARQNLLFFVDQYNKGIITRMYCCCCFQEKTLKL